MKALLLSAIARDPTLHGVYLAGSGVVSPSMATMDGGMSIILGGERTSLHLLKQEIQSALV